MKRSNIDIKIIINKSKRSKVVFYYNEALCFLINGSCPIGNDIVTLAERY